VSPTSCKVAVSERPSTAIRRLGCAPAQTGLPRVARQEAAWPSRRVLVVDGDTAARAILSVHLEGHGYHVEAARNAAEMEVILDRGPIDLIVLDVMLPGEGGLSICRRVARPGGPAIIIVSDLCDETERIVGLEVGADDYLSKDCNPRELLARVRAVLRRCDRRGRRPAGDVRLLGWRLDAALRQVRSPHGSVANLTAGEFALLQVFVDRPLQVLSREQLRGLTGAEDQHANDRTIDMQISRLRHKLADCGGRDLIRTQRHEGYVFAACVPSSGEGHVFEHPGRSTQILPHRPASPDHSPRLLSLPHKE
jgi:two-component system, OmpR family, response regulator